MVASYNKIHVVFTSVRDLIVIQFVYLVGLIMAYFVQISYIYLLVYLYELGTKMV